MILHTVELLRDNWGEYCILGTDDEYVCGEGLADYIEEFDVDRGDAPKNITIVFHTHPGKGRLRLFDPQVNYDQEATMVIDGTLEEVFHHAAIDVQDMLAMRKGRRAVYAEVRIIDDPEDEE